MPPVQWRILVWMDKGWDRIFHWNQVLDGRRCKGRIQGLWILYRDEKSGFMPDKNFGSLTWMNPIKNMKIKFSEVVDSMVGNQGSLSMILPG